MTNDFADLRWNRSVCISVVSCCKIFRGIFFIMENILGNSLGLHVSISFLFVGEVTFVLYQKGTF